MKLDVPSGFRGATGVDDRWLDQALIDDEYPLPASYLRFAREYGYGRALGLLIVFAPSPQHPDSLLSQGKKVREFIHMALDGRYLEFEPDGSEELAKRLSPFAMSENGEYLAWALGDGGLNSDGRPEYPIYCLAARMGGIRYAARDLDELLRRLVSPDVKAILGPGYLPLPARFQPIK